VICSNNVSLAIDHWQLAIDNLKMVRLSLKLSTANGQLPI